MNYLTTHKHIKHFFIVWCLYYLVLLLIPVKSITPGYWLFQVYQISCVLFSIGLYFLIMCALGVNIKPRLKPEALECLLEYNRRKFKRIFFWGVVISIVASFFVLYDKIFFQHIDFSKGMAYAHAQWSYSRKAQQPHGVSSILSVLGYLFGCTFYISSAFVVIFWEKLPLVKKFLSLVCISSIVFFQTYVSGGRSVLALFCVFMLGVCLFRSSFGSSFLPIKKLKLFLLVVFIVIFLGAVFQLRISLYHNGMNSQHYAEQFIRMFQASPTNNFYLFQEVIGGVMYILILLLCYFVNSAWIFPAAVLHHGLDIGFSYRAISFLLGKAHLIAQKLIDFPFPGTNLSFFASFFYDFSWVGMLFSILLMSSMMVAITIILSKRKVSVLGIVVVGCSYSVLFFSPMLNAMNIMMFPYVVFSGFVLQLFFGNNILIKRLFIKLGHGNLK